tara:strand:- start:267 stop:395 length:129 start_codon:yes stop_codon:yes gene_type:complete
VARAEGGVKNTLDVIVWVGVQSKTPKLKIKLKTNNINTITHF